MCNLPTMSSKRVEFRHLIDQIDWFCEHVLIPESFREFETVTVGNNGSILDPDTFPPSALFYLMARARALCPKLKRFSFITRPEYVTESILGCLMEEALTYVDRPASEGPSLDIEITVGVEAISPKATKPMKKGFGKKEVEALGATLARWNETARSPHKEDHRFAKRVSPPEFSLRGYFLLKPYPLDDEEAVGDVVAGFDFLSALRRKSGVRTTLHLNPTYVAKGTEVAVAVARGEDYSPPSVDVIARSLLAIRDFPLQTGLSQASICLGLSDEGMAEEGKSFVPPAELQAEGSLWQALSAFNADTSDNKHDGFARIDAAMTAQRERRNDGKAYASVGGT